MRKTLIFGIVLIIMAIAYFVVGEIFLLKQTRKASEKIIASIMLVGDNAEKSYSPKITLFPLSVSMSNLKISGDEAFINGYKWYDVRLQSENINLNLSDVFSGRFPKINSMSGFTFAGKIPFHAISKMLEEKNQGWTETKVGRLGDKGDIVYIYSKNKDNGQSVNLIGHLLVNKDGYILFLPLDTKYYDDNGKLNIELFNEARQGMELNWSFEFFNIIVPINRVAVSESGLYMETGEIVKGGLGDPNQVDKTN